MCAETCYCLTNDSASYILQLVENSGACVAEAVRQYRYFRILSGFILIFAMFPVFIYFVNCYW